ncbi:MAG TPA: DUF523 and DUF1722 domain-containing protein [Acidimicrobiia bacterium]|nr:DUF523 and DUF1722 domain-containing protein [Acidimicrobiia bacterium]
MVAIDADRTRPRLGISSCLLGEPVRFDGGHKRDQFLVEVLSRFVEWVPVCPEVEMGLGAPRPTLRLVTAGEGVRLVAPDTGSDHTEGMRRFAEQRLEELASADLCGYVLKRASPSCGMERVKVYDGDGNLQQPARGLFAAALLERFPELPVEEEGRLNNPLLRDHFLERVFALHRVKRLFAAGWTPGQLVAFHSAHKLVLLAHSPQAYRDLGRLVATAGTADPEDLAAAYRQGFLQAMAVRATTGRHVNVLEHMLGYFKRDLGEASRADIHAAIADYRQGLVPLAVPKALIRHQAIGQRVDYLLGQVYLDPGPKELKDHTGP